MNKACGHHEYPLDKPEIIYVYDALCGWCYGFSPVITQIYSTYRCKADFLVLSGGMITGDRCGAIGTIAPFIKKAYKNVEQTCGVKFGDQFLTNVLNDGNVWFSSEYPARALALMRLEKKDHSLNFATKLQKAIYYDGQHPHNLATYESLVSLFGLDGKKFIESMMTDDISQIIENEFRMVKQIGVDGYPTVLLRCEDDLKMIAIGYRDFDSLHALLDKELA